MPLAMTSGGKVEATRLPMDSTFNERLFELIERIYDAVGDDQRW